MSKSKSWAEFNSENEQFKKSPEGRNGEQLGFF